jgi:hypothetical protein
MEDFCWAVWAEKSGEESCGGNFAGECQEGDIHVGESFGGWEDISKGGMG